ncbi:transmembrane protein 156 isoform X1 [Falco cherrug]|uniref:transmembrane protein 156 isoform X1 n=2 Tax=Falco cherrug TaxID=345164 RepID=UPI002479070A|nr:transmembrane protein 156 isoform X1 [Falco cherrug]
MCLLLRKSEVFKLVLGIITMFILCLPEFFKIHEANTVIVSCMDTCSSHNTTFPLCTFNNSCKRAVQHRRENQTVLLKAIVNHSSFHDLPCVCQSSRREQQSHTKHTNCESKRDANVDHQGSGSVARKTKGLLEVKREDVIYSYKYFNFTTVSEKEEVEHNTYYLLEMHINNSVVGGRNAAEEHLNHSCLLAMMEDQNDCINISLQLKSYVEYPMCMAKIIWLTMIAIVFVFTISIVIYKIVQENEQNYCKHRVAAAVSTILRRKSFGYAGRTISTTKIHPFPVKTSKQQIPLTAQTTEKLPIIPEQEHCHVGASTIEVADVAV